MTGIAATTNAKQGTIMTIEVVQRANDFMCFLDGDRGKWDCGKTIAEAIGNCIWTHWPLFESVTILGQRLPHTPDETAKVRVTSFRIPGISDALSGIGFGAATEPHTPDESPL